MKWKTTKENFTTFLFGWLCVWLLFGKMWKRSTKISTIWNYVDWCRSWSRRVKVALLNNAYRMHSMEFMAPPLFTESTPEMAYTIQHSDENGFGALVFGRWVLLFLFFYICCFLVNGANVISVRKIIVENCLVKSFEKHESNYVQPQRYMRMESCSHLSKGFTLNSLDTWYIYPWPLV